MPITIDGELVDPIKGMNIGGVTCDVTIDGETVHFKNEFKLHLEYFTIEYDGEWECWLSHTGGAQYMRAFNTITHRTGKGQAPPLPSQTSHNFRLSTRSSYEADGVNMITIERSGASNKSLIASTQTGIGGWSSSSNDSSGIIETFNEGDVERGYHRLLMPLDTDNNFELDSVTGVGNAMQLNTASEGTIELKFSFMTCKEGGY